MLKFGYDDFRLPLT